MTMKGCMHAGSRPDMSPVAGFQVGDWVCAWNDHHTQQIAPFSWPGYGRAQTSLVLQRGQRIYCPVVGRTPTGFLVVVVTERPESTNRHAYVLRHDTMSVEPHSV